MATLKAIGICLAVGFGALAFSILAWFIVQVWTAIRSAWLESQHKRHELDTIKERDRIENEIRERHARAVQLLPDEHGLLGAAYDTLTGAIVNLDDHERLTIESGGKPGGERWDVIARQRLLAALPGGGAARQVMQETEPEQTLLLPGDPDLSFDTATDESGADDGMVVIE